MISLLFKDLFTTLIMRLIRANSLAGVIQGLQRPGGEHFFSQAGRVQFADAVLQVIILIDIQPANGGAVDAEHDAGLAVRVAGLVNAVIERQDGRRLAGLQERAFDFL